MRYPFALHMLQFHPLSETARLYQRVLGYEQAEKAWEELVDLDDDEAATEAPTEGDTYDRD